MSIELALISPVDIHSSIPRMRLALGLLDISAIKKSAREQFHKDRDLQSPKKRTKLDMASSAKLPDNENKSPFKNTEGITTKPNQPKSGYCLKRHKKH
jgi:hypothetical protein